MMAAMSPFPTSPPARALCDAALNGKRQEAAVWLAQGASAAPACLQALQHGLRHTGRRWAYPDEAQNLI